MHKGPFTNREVDMCLDDLCDECVDKYCHKCPHYPCTVEAAERCIRIPCLSCGVHRFRKAMHLEVSGTIGKRKR